MCALFAFSEQFNTVHAGHIFKPLVNQLTRFFHGFGYRADSLVFTEVDELRVNHGCFNLLMAHLLLHEQYVFRLMVGHGAEIVS